MKKIISFIICLLYNLLHCSLYGQQFNVVGNATALSCTCYEINPAFPWQAGAIWNNNPINLTNSFDFKFRVYLGVANPNNWNSCGPGADGICFVLQNTNAGYYSAGGGLGYEGFPNQSIGIELDTYQNFWDPPYSHVAIETAGQVMHPTGTLAGPVQMSASQYYTMDGNWHTFEIVWNATTQTISTYFDGVFRLSYAFPGGIITNIFNGNGSNIYWGFTGSTGEYCNLQEVCLDIQAGFTTQTTCGSNAVNFTNTSISSLNSIQGYAWAFGDGGTSNVANPTYTYAVPGTYTVSLEITDQSLCTSTISHTVVVGSSSPVLNDSIYGANCAGNTGSATVNITGGTGKFAVAWNPIPLLVQHAGNSYTAQDPAPGIYNFYVTDTISGCKDTLQFSVATSVPPGISIAPPGTLICTLAQVTLSASSSTSGVNYKWNGGMNGATENITNPGTYTVTVTNPANGCTASASSTVAQNIVLPNVSIAPPSTLTCAVTGVTLAASSTTGGVDYDWDGGGNSATENVTNPGTYSVTVTSPANGCTASASTIVAQNIAAPNINIIPPATLTCAVTAVTLATSSTTPGITYNWNGGGNASTENIINPGAYSVTVTNPANGCIASASSTVAQNIAAPNISIIPPATLTCAVTAITLATSSTTPGIAYSWNGGGNASTENIINPGTYSVTVTNPVNGCTASTSTIVAQNIAAPNINIIPPAVLTCAVTAITLATSSTTPGIAYSWNGGGNASTENIINPGTYSVTVTNPANGCTASASSMVAQNITTPNISIAPPATLTCTVTSVTLSASSVTPGVVYSWNGGVNAATENITNPGTYSVTVTNPVNGCTASASSTVAQNITTPNISIAPPAMLTCVVTSVSLAASSVTPGVTYSWNDGANTATENIINPGTYSVTVTNPANGCTASASSTVAQNIAIPNISIAPPSTLTCTVTSVTLAASSITPGVTYSWNGGANTATENIINPGTYSVTVTNPANGCTASASSTVAQNIAIPNISIAPPSTLTCAVTSVTLAASSVTPSVTYSWNGGANAASENISNPGTYSVTVTDLVNGCTASASITGAQNIATPGISIAPPSILTCAVTSVTLAASSITPGVTYSWNGGANAATENIINPGTYSVTVTDSGNGCTASTSTTVAQNITTPDISIAPPATLTCAVTSITLAASSITTGVTYSWNGGDNAATENVTIAGSYSVTVTDPANGCMGSNSVTVIQNIATPNISIAPPATLTCVATSISLTASSTAAGAAYSWNSGVNNATDNVINPGTYSVTVTDPGNGCTASASATVTQNIATPNISIAPPASLTCAVTSVTLTASSATNGVNFNWGGGGNGTTEIVINPGTYSVTATDPGNGCTASASTNVIQNIATPNISIAPPASLTCAVTSVTLTASSTTNGVTFNWGGGGNGTTENITNPGTYSVTATDPGNGCTASASTNVIQNIATPNISIAPPATLTCAVTTATLTASSTTNGTTYNWDGGRNGITENIINPGTYSVTASDPGDGCTASASSTVSQNITAPNISIAPPAILTCALTSISLMASSTAAGATYSWNSGENNATENVINPGTYSVTVTDPGNGCTASASTTVTQNIATPTASIVPPATLTCATTSISLTASSTANGATYSWNGGVNTATENIISPGTYSVTVTDPGNGCTASASSSVTQNITAPNISIALPASLTCTVTSVTITASSTTNGVTFNWGGGGNGTTKNVINSGTYSVTATDPGNGCTAIASTNVIQNIATPNISIAPPATLTCAVTSVNLTASSTTIGATYGWSNGGTGPIENVSAAGTYWVTVTDQANSCTASSSVAVTQSVPLPNVSIAVPAILTCTSTSVTLTASSTTTGATYDWGGGLTGLTRAVILPGTYSVTVTDPSSGCMGSNSVTVIQDITVPGVSIAPPTILTCVITSMSLTASSTAVGTAYSWNGGVNAATDNVTNPGTYSVTVTDAGNGCTASASSTVIQNIIAPNISIAPPVTLTCAVTNITLSATSTTTGVTYSWNGGGIGITENIINPGIYSVTATDPGNGCTASASSTVAQNIATPNISIVPSATLTCAVTTVTLSASSTTTGVTYGWDGGGNGTTELVINPGTYSVTVTDPGNGCTASTSSTVTQDITVPNISIAPPATLTCAVTAVTLTASSTTTGATYLWDGGESGVTENVTSAGNYSVTATDPANSCTASASVAVTQSVPLPNVSIANPATLTCTNTSITLTASSTTVGVTYNWGAGVTGATMPADLPGAYSVTVTDPSNGCMGSNSVTVIQNIIVPDISIAPPAILTCATTSINLTASSTTAGATYSWNSGVNNATENVINPGTYSITATDPDNGCTASASSTVAQNIATPNISIAPPATLTCAVTTVTLSASSTTIGVTYNWDGGGNGTTELVINPGTYSVTATDPGNGCTASTSSTVTQNITAPNISITPPATLTCAITVVTLTASPTTTGATYIWDGGGNGTTENVTTAGSYSVTATDPANGCTAVASVTVTQSAPLPNVTVATPATLTCTNTNVTLTASSTTTGVTYNWGGGITGVTRSVNLPGTYSVTATDPSNGCLASNSVTVIQNIIAPNVSIVPPATLTCATTSIGLTASSAAVGATYNWNSGVNAATENIINPGTYSVTVTDPVNGCTASASSTVAQNIATPNISIVPPATLTCAVTTITLSASCTTTGVAYSWDGGGNGTTENVINPGTYSITATDPGNGCTASASTNVIQNISVPNISIAPPAALTCAVSSVSLTASSTSTGTTYNWDGGGNGETENVTSAGNYSVTATDPVNSCTASASVAVTQSVPVPDVRIANPAILTCTDTSVTLTASSTTVGATFSWAGGITGASRSVDLPGDYSVTATDPSSGCMGSNSATVIQNVTLPGISIAPPATLTCAIVAVTLTASSTTTGATYIWNGGGNGITENVINPGTYSVTATDPGNGCSASASSTVVQNVTSANVSIAPPATLTCAVTTVTLTASSSTNGTTYSWSAGGSGATENIINPGTYSVTATDPGNGCTASAAVTVIQSVPVPNVSIAAPATLTCTNTNIILTASSTTAGVTYNWGGSITGATRSVSLPGNYSVTATDPANGCLGSTSVAVIQNVTAPGVNINPPATLTCALTTATLTASSTTAGATYSWSGGGNGTTENVINPGTYSVTATDPGNGCTASVSSAVAQNIAAPQISIAPPATLTCTTTSVTLTASCNAAGATYSWSGGADGATKNVSTAGTYWVTATDPANGCSASLSTVVTSISSLAISIAGSNVSCNGGNNGYLQLSVSGGAVPYSFTWNNGDTSQDANKLLAGRYQVTVKDKIGCTADITGVITEPAALVPGETHEPVTCKGFNNGAIDITVTGGTAPYYFLWSDGLATRNRANLPAGTYSLIVSDSNSCSATLSVIIDEPSALALSENHSNATCYNNTNGVIHLNVSGGTSPYTYSWSDVSLNGSNGTNLSAGSYSITVNDFNHCSTLLTIDITDPSPLNILPSVIQPPCPEKGITGSISLTVSGSNPPYQYMWSNGVATADNMNLSPGVYSVTISDANFCSADSAFVLNYMFDFTVHAGPSVTINLGETVQLNYTVNGQARNITSNIWTPVASLSCSDCASPNATPNVTTEYLVTVENEIGCQSSDTVTIYVNSDYNIFVPNAFTPNGDGNNDFFEIFGNLEGVDYLDMMVFNRWGEKVFESNSHHFQWDGSYKGVIQDPQVFVWMLKLTFRDGHTEPLRTGSVTLIR